MFASEYNTFFHAYLKHAVLQESMESKIAIIEEKETKMSGRNARYCISIQVEHMRYNVQVVSRKIHSIGHFFVIVPMSFLLFALVTGYIKARIQDS